MITINHRVNSIDQLICIPREQGVEVDVRSHRGNLILAHEPMADGVSLEQWLTHYYHKHLILNVKEEGLENRLIMEMRRFCIDDYFFLDQSFPFLLKTSKSGESRSAVRVSEYESVETALSLQGRVDWVWLDNFDRIWYDNVLIDMLKSKGFRVCLVSPELQGLPQEYISKIKTILSQCLSPIDAVCTKNPDRWLS